jgi:biopolymer transport protein ExbD
MGKQTISHDPEEAHINLTPMIDVTFQLIIFFMLVSELTNMTMLNVTLPVAPNAEELKEPENPLQKRVIINITADGEIAFGTHDFVPGKGEKLLENLVDRLRLEAEARQELWSKNTQGGGKRVSELKLFVRCDREVDAKYFLYVMHACNQVPLYKVDVGTKLSYSGD